MTILTILTYPNLILTPRSQVTGAARYSQYPPAYVKPVYLPDKLQEMEDSGETKNLEFQPIRAAYNTHTSSVFHDPLVRCVLLHIELCLSFCIGYCCVIVCVCVCVCV